MPASHVYFTQTIHFIWLGSSLRARPKECLAITQWADHAFYQQNYHIQLWYDPQCLSDNECDQMSQFAQSHSLQLCDVNHLSQTATTRTEQSLIMGYQQLRDDCVHQLWATASDLLRLVILYQQGGIYLDTDIWPAQTSSETLQQAVDFQRFGHAKNPIPPETRTTFPKEGVCIDNDLGVLLCHYSQSAFSLCLQSNNQTKYYGGDVTNDFLIARPASPFIETCLQKLKNEILDTQHSLVNRVIQNIYNDQFHEPGRRFKNAIIDLGPGIIQSVASYYQNVLCQTPNVNALTQDDDTYETHTDKQILVPIKQVIKSEYLSDSLMTAVLPLYNNASWLHGHNSMRFNEIERVPLRQFTSRHAFERMAQRMFKHITTATFHYVENHPEIITLLNFKFQTPANLRDNFKYRIRCYLWTQQLLNNAHENSLMAIPAVWFKLHIPNIFDAEQLDALIDFSYLWEISIQLAPEHLAREGRYLVKPPQNIQQIEPRHLRFLKAQQAIFGATNDPCTRAQLIQQTQEAITHSVYISLWEEANDYQIHLAHTNDVLSRFLHTAALYSVSGLPNADTNELKAHFKIVFEHNAADQLTIRFRPFIQNCHELFHSVASHYYQSRIIHHLCQELLRIVDDWPYFDHQCYFSALQQLIDEINGTFPTQANTSNPKQEKDQLFHAFDALRGVLRHIHDTINDNAYSYQRYTFFPAQGRAPEPESKKCCVII